MDRSYIETSIFTTFKDITEKNYTLSATQYKSLQIKNKNISPLAAFLDRDLRRTDLGYEVGSESYIENAPYAFIKTKALQTESYLLDITTESVQHITVQNYKNMNLKKGDVLISKDSNVGEIVILDKEYPNTMLCGGIYRLPISKYKYYLLAFIKSEFFKQQIDFLIPRGSTIRHGKTKFLDCMIPMPNYSSAETIEYVELLMRAIINKEIEIKKKHEILLKMIQNELLHNQTKNSFLYSLPTIDEITKLDRMDSSLYSKEFKEKEYLIRNYVHGVATIKELGFEIKRGQNLQISNIGKSLQTKAYRKGYYMLILPMFLSKYGTVNTVEYLGNPNSLKTLNKGDIIFGAEGNEKGRSTVIIEEQDKAITNIHGITINQNSHNLQKGIFIKLFLDYYRSKGMIDAYAVGGNGGSLAIKYWDFLKFPNFPSDIENKLAKMYYNPDAEYDIQNCTTENFIEYDTKYNEIAGIYNLDKSMKHLKIKLNKAINNIIDDKDVMINF